jgi:hypothetical protein
MIGGGNGQNQMLKILLFEVKSSGFGFLLWLLWFGFVFRCICLLFSWLGINFYCLFLNCFDILRLLRSDGSCFWYSWGFLFDFSLSRFCFGHWSWFLLSKISLAFRFFLLRFSSLSLRFRLFALFLRFRWGFNCLSLFDRHSGLCSSCLITHWFSCLYCHDLFFFSLHFTFGLFFFILGGFDWLWISL